MPFSVKNYWTDIVGTAKHNSTVLTYLVAGALDNTTVHFDFGILYDPHRIKCQANVFALTLLGQEDFIAKYAFGTREDEWPTKAEQSYIYDTVRAIVLGYYSNLEPVGSDSDRHTFPGNGIMRKWLSQRSFTYQASTEPQVTVSAKINVEKSQIDKILKQVKTDFPFLKDAFDIIEGSFVSFDSSEHNRYLSSIYSQQENARGTYFIRIDKYNDPSHMSYIQSGNNPLGNACLSQDGTKFKFLPYSSSVYKNESFGLSRALGIYIFDDSDKCGDSESPYYMTANRVPAKDILTMNDVWSITWMLCSRLPQWSGGKLVYNEEKIISSFLHDSDLSDEDEPAKL